MKPTISIADTPAPAATPSVTLSGIISDVLTWIGLPALEENSSIPALPIPEPIASFWLAVRQVQYRFNNRYPTASPTTLPSDPQTGVVTGALHATDLDGDYLTYTLASQPIHGTVAINLDGTFTYTPSPAEARAGGTDTFTVTVSDDGAANVRHIHGLLGLLGVRSAPTVAVPVAVTPVSAPTVTISAVAGTPNPVTGVTTITITGGDSAGNALTFTGTSNQGTVAPSPTQSVVLVFTPGTGYTPTDVATDPSHATDVVTIVATDATGASATATVTIIQEPTTSIPPAPPTISRVNATQTLGTPGYRIVVTATDPANKPLTYTVDTGTLTANTDGSYIYLATTGAQQGPVSFALTGTDTDGQAITTQVKLAYFTGTGTYITGIYHFQTVTFTSIGEPYVVSQNGSPLYTGGNGTPDANGVVTETYRLGAPGDTVFTDTVTVQYNQFDPLGNDAYNRVFDITTLLARDLPVAGTPTVGTPDIGTGTVTGTTNFTDPAGLALTYAVTGNPGLGAVSIINGGGFSYTPTASARGDAATGGPTADAFTVTATNQTGAYATVTVTVPVQPLIVDQAPAAPSTQGAVTYAPVSGIATGSMGFTDPDGDPLTYIVTTAPTYGTVTLTGGTFTYTPTPAGRALAATTPGLTDGFTVTASDGQLTTPTILQVSVIPAVASGPVSIAVGINPVQVVVTPDGSTIYVTNFGRYVSSGQPHVGDSVSVIDTASNTVIKTIQVGNHPLGLAITPNGSTVYVGNFDDSTVSVISTATNTVVGTIPVGALPRTVVVTADGVHVLVASGSIVSEPIPVVLSVIDTATNTVSKTIRLTDIGYPTAVVSNSDGSVIYVTDRVGSRASVVVGGTPTRSVYTGGAYPGESTPVSAVLDGNTLYVADDYYSQVTVVDVTGNEGRGAISNRINLPVQPAQIVQSLDGMSLYVGGDNAVLKIDKATGAVTTLATITDALIQGITLSPDGTVLYATNTGVANESDDALLVFPLI
ncbi:Ig-like domain-containing protein [Mycolicibacterium hodleri]|uniref:Uncharacterized protein n=1 Tax=Mycolicibacterium hodleri TaxID=49897 RepID=A0A502DL63_9MYCO|nr:Ig-like domain-containing protein [Mycolicibacterium hodleri]TPG25219.1 hypothetical protein EAH80_30655 [Mycolicibacterium hodleri]